MDFTPGSIKDDAGWILWIEIKVGVGSDSSLAIYHLTLIDVEFFDRCSSHFIAPHTQAL